MIEIVMEEVELELPANENLTEIKGIFALLRVRRGISCSLSQTLQSVFSSLPMSYVCLGSACSPAQIQAHELFSQLAPDHLFSLDDSCNLAIWGTHQLVHSPAK